MARIDISGNYGETITATRKFDDTQFSPSEISTLKDVIDKFASSTTNRIVNISHGEKAWKENEPSHDLISYQKYAFELQAIE
jgi:hypothetical protein